jgi:hypothetical protein
MPAKLRLSVKTTLRVAVNLDAFRPQHPTEMNGHLVSSTDGGDYQ